jgi:hypothetical protein
VWQARPPQHATCSSTRCGSCILSPPTSVWPPAPPGAASSPLATRQPLSLSLCLFVLRECFMNVVVRRQGGGGGLVRWRRGDGTAGDFKVRWAAVGLEAQIRNGWRHKGTSE